MNNALLRTALALALAAAALPGCIEMAAVGVGAAVLSAEDRRTTGAQVDDEGIELRISNRVTERFRDKAHVNVISYNRSVLLTGEVPDGQVRSEVEKIAAGTVNVRGVTNELQVGGASSFTSRANDAAITGKVKARFLDSGKLNPIHVKVVTENATVYLLGIVTEPEAEEAVRLARTTGGVRKVVKIFEYCKPSDPVCAPRPAHKAEEPKKSGS